MRPKIETVGEIKKENTLVTYTYADSLIVKVAEDLAHNHWTGMPVVDREKRVIGMVSEQDVLRAFRDYEPLLLLDEIKIKEIMTEPPIVINENTTLQEASKIMEDAHIYQLPVVKNGVLTGTVTEHDLLRAWLGMNVEEGANYQKNLF